MDLDCGQYFLTGYVVAISYSDDSPKVAGDVLRVGACFRIFLEAEVFILCLLVR